MFTPEFQAHLCALSTYAAHVNESPSSTLASNLDAFEFTERPQFCDPPDHCGAFSPESEERLVALRSLASNNVESVRYELDHCRRTDTTELHFLSPNSCDTPGWLAHLHGRVTSISSLPLDDIHNTFQQAQTNGLTVVELFGGMASGLEMCLRNGFPIRRYIYCDKSDSARAIARHRLQGLSLQYPDLLPPSVWEHAFSTLPQDVYSITPAHLLAAGCNDGSQWFLIAGFECQDLSPAGSGAGLAGSRSNSFYPLLQILGELQSLQNRFSNPPMYLIENTAMQCTSHVRPAVQSAFDEICLRLGQPVLLDAARMGSYAHRLRNYWTNLCDPPW